MESAHEVPADHGRAGRTSRRHHCPGPGRSQVRAGNAGRIDRGALAGSPRASRHPSRAGPGGIDRRLDGRGLREVHRRAGCRDGSGRVDRRQCRSGVYGGAARSVPPDHPHGDVRWGVALTPCPVSERDGRLRDLGCSPLAGRRHQARHGQLQPCPGGAAYAARPEARPDGTTGSGRSRLPQLCPAGRRRPHVGAPDLLHGGILARSVPER